ncbi:MAG TPA: ABC transporter permease, partial [Blastocatellia bacterium]|nr:ABC transporter permease [Blastocatellia bacterium]
RTRVPGLNALGAMSLSDLVLENDDPNHGDPIAVSGVACSTSLFDVLHVEPLRGRLFDPVEELPGAGVPVALIGEELWRGRYGSDPNILGKTIKLNEDRFTVIGVAKAGLRLPPEPAAAAVLIPLGSDPLLAQVKKMFPSDWDRVAYLGPLWGRLGDGYSVNTVEKQLRATTQPLLALDDPDSPPDAELHLKPVEEQIRSQYALETRVLVLASVLILMVSSFNVSSLILGRSLSRRAEIALRLALGESRLRIAAGVLVEGALISLLGVVAGVVAAELTLGALASIIPQGLLPYEGVPLSTWAIVLTGVVAAVSGIGASIWPAVGAARLDRNLLASLHRSTAAGRPMKLNRQVLVAAQIGCAVLAMALFVSLLRTYRNIISTRLGFNPDSVLVASLRMPQNGASGERWKNLGIQMIDQLASQEGVISASIALSPPLIRSLRTSYTIPGNSGSRTGLLADYRVVGPNYFSVLGIPVLKGRAFSRSDNLEARRVCIVSETLARSALVAGQEIGAQIKPQGMEPCEVIGVAGDVASYDLRSRPAPAMYIPFEQMSTEIIQGFMSMLVRTNGASQGYRISRLSETVRAVAPTLPANIQLLTATVRERSSLERFRALLMGTVSLIAVILAGCGIYGIAASDVVEQRRTLTIRMALGATAGRVIRSVLRNTLVLAGVGLILGFAVAYPILKALGGILFGTAGLESTAVAACSISIPLISCLSAYIPARRILLLCIADVLKDT